MHQQRVWVFLTALVVFFLAMFLVAGCRLTVPQAPPTRAILTGTAVVPVQTKQIQGQALANATVKVIDPRTGEVVATGTTDADGRYSVEVPPGGPYIVEVSKGNLRVLDLSPKVEAGKTYDLGTADATSTAIALIFQAMVKEGKDPEAIDIDAIPGMRGFGNLVNAIEDALQAGQDPTQSQQVMNLVNIILSPPSAPSAPEVPEALGPAFILIPTPVTGVTLDRTAMILPKGKSQQLVATVTPANATDKRVVWSSSDESVATVNQNGVVTAKDVGEATITVTTVDGGFTAQCNVTVALVVNITQEKGYDTIQAAIDEANNGDTIEVGVGTYYENIVINKPLTLRGINRPVVDGSTKASQGWDGSVVIVGANGVTIEGFEIRYGANGIAGETSNSVIRNNIIHHNYNYKGSNGVGILLWGDNDNNLIEDNIIHDNDRQGIFIGFDSASKISSSNTILGNEIHDNGLYTYPNGPDASAYGIQLWNADSNIIEDNDIYHHDDWFPYSGFDFAQGIYLHNSAGNVVQSNDLHDNNYGVGVWCPDRGAGTNKINNNNISGNTGYGVRNFDSVGIDATNNWWGAEDGPSGGVTDPCTTDNKVANGAGDKVSANVCFYPWLTTEP